MSRGWGLGGRKGTSTERRDPRARKQPGEVPSLHLELPIRG